MDGRSAIAGRGSAMTSLQLGGDANRCAILCLGKPRDIAIGAGRSCESRRPRGSI